MMDDEQDEQDEREGTAADMDRDHYAEAMGESADRQRSLEDLRVDAQLRIGMAHVALKSILSIKVGEVIPWIGRSLPPCR